MTGNVHGLDIRTFDGLQEYLTLDQGSAIPADFTSTLEYLAHNLAIDFDDLNGVNIANWSISPDKAARRLYVRRGDQTVSGIDAFIILWSEMPRYRWLFHFIRQPVIKQFSGLIYDNLLAPFIYYLHLKRQKITKNK